MSEDEFQRAKLTSLDKGSRPSSPTYGSVDGEREETADDLSEIHVETADGAVHKYPADSYDEGPEEGGPTYTIEEAVETVGFGRLQYRLLGIAGFVWMADAMEMMILSFLGPALQCDWDISDSEMALITTVVFLGMFGGAYTWGIFSDRFGRRYGYLATAMFTAVFGLLSAFAPSYAWMLVLRFLVGFGIGGVHVAFSLFCEFLPIKRRGFWLILIEAFWTVGSIFSAALAWATISAFGWQDGWRWLVGLSAVPCTIMIGLYGFLPESPRYLEQAGKLEKAQIVINKMARVNRKKLPEGELRVDNVSERKVRLTALWKPNVRRTTTLVWIIWFANAFVYYGMVLLATKLEEDEEEEDGGNPCTPWKQSKFVSVFIEALAEFPGIILSFFIVDKLGRKKSMAVLLAGCFVALACIIGTGGGITSVVFLFFARAFITGCFAVIYVVTPEVYPTIMRTTAMGAANSFARAGGMISPYIAQVLTSKNNARLPAAIYGVVCAGASCASMALPFETSGQQLPTTLEDAFPGGKHKQKSSRVSSDNLKMDDSGSEGEEDALAHKEQKKYRDKSGHKSRSGFHHLDDEE